MTNSRKLNPLAEMALIDEIVIQSKFAEMAAIKLENTSDRIEVWGSIQSILVAAANVSKILWPVKKSSKKRGEHLRKLLSVDESNLLYVRTIRNHFEHYDERIEDWFNKNNSLVYRDLRINPFEPRPWSFPQFFHRSYNPVSKKLSFRGETIDLARVINSLLEIREKCQDFTLT
jgi:hypothetical protein